MSRLELIKHREARYAKWTGFGFTASVVLIVCFVGLVFRDLDAARKLKLSEWGEFISGLTGALGFLWLVLAFLQQREELFQNNKALLLQYKELTKNVKETKKLAESTNRLAQASERLVSMAVMQFQPRLVSRGIVVTPRPGHFTLPFVNEGGKCLVLGMVCQGPDITFDIKPCPYIEQGAQGEIDAVGDVKIDELVGKKFIFKYRDHLQIERCQVFVIDGRDTGFRESGSLLPLNCPPNDC